MSVIVGGRGGDVSVIVGGREGVRVDGFCGKRGVGEYCGVVCGTQW